MVNSVHHYLDLSPNILLIYNLSFVQNCSSGSTRDRSRTTSPTAYAVPLPQRGRQV